MTQDKTVTDIKILKNTSQLIWRVDLQFEYSKQYSPNTIYLSRIRLKTEKRKFREMNHKSLKRKME